jgi:hypothetical protein
MMGSRWRRSLLRRPLRALGAAPRRKAAIDGKLTRASASHDAAAGLARAAGGYGEAAIPMSKARAPAVATVVVLAAVCCVSSARADNAPPPTTPTSTTPEAPPPDPYKAPPKVTPKASQPRRSAPVVHSAPVYHAPVRTYTPATPAVGTRAAQPQRTSRPRPAKVVHKRKTRVVHRHVAPKPKPVKVTFNPFTNFVAASSVLGTSGDTNDRARYLWFAGFAFAVLALAGLSMHFLSVRMAQ